MDGVIVIDCGEEYSVSTRGVATATVKQYKKNVLPVLAHYDDFGKLTVVNNHLHLRDPKRHVYNKKIENHLFLNEIKYTCLQLNNYK